MVKRYWIKHDDDRCNDFQVRYRINLATMSPDTYGNNSELAALNAFMDSLARDSMMHVKCVTITGYASPDGVEASNQRLAHARAVNFKNYLDKRYGLSNRYKVNIEAVVDNWDACERALRNSNIENRDEAVRIIRSRDDRTDKERRLKAMPAVWNYLASDVLPPLRQADIAFDYGHDDIAETRVLLVKSAPAQRPAAKATPAPKDYERCRCCGCDIRERVVVVEDMTNGLIVAMGEDDVDF